VLMRIGKGRGVATPHLIGGTDREKILWEFKHAPVLWEVLDGFVTPEMFAGREILDVGSGWGGKAVYLAETTALARITGFDLPGVFRPEAAVAFARERGVEDRCTFTTGQAEEIPFADSQFELVLMDDVLEHVADPERVLSECRRVLKPGGLVVARFPSIRMLRAHHFDRALRFPGLHYLMSMQAWAQGFNYYLLHNRAGVRFEPFSRVDSTRFGRAVTRNLNGMDLRAFRRVAAGSGLRVKHLELVGYPRARLGSKAPLIFPFYRLLRSLPGFREPLSRTIIFIGQNQLGPH